MGILEQVLNSDYEYRNSSRLGHSDIGRQFHHLSEFLNHKTYNGLVELFNDSGIRAIPRDGSKCAVSQYLIKTLGKRELERNRLAIATSGRTIHLGHISGDTTYVNCSQNLAQFVMDYDELKHPQLVDRDWLAKSARTMHYYMPEIVKKPVPVEPAIASFVPNDISSLVPEMKYEWVSKLTAMTNA